MSSAHVYIRLSRGQTIADITKEARGRPYTRRLCASFSKLTLLQELEDCCQLVKAHSIAGHKAPTVAVVYTPWSNLRKTSDMEVGQVGFTSEKEVIRTGNISRNNEALNRLMRTRKELFPNWATVRADWDAEERAIRKEAERIRKKEDATLERERRKEAEERSYHSELSGAPAATA